MARWGQAYAAHAKGTELAPVYCLFIIDGEAQIRNDVASTTTVVQIALKDLGDISLDAFDDVLLYDHDNFEMVTVGSWNTASNQIDDATRGAWGTTAHAFSASPSSTNGVALITKPLFSFATSQPQGSTFPFALGMGFPSGSGQELDTQEGHTRTNPVTVTVPDNGLTEQLAGVSLIGKRAIIMGGYVGLPFKYFSFLHIGRITDFAVRGATHYQFTVGDVTAKLKKKLFQDVDDFTATLGGSLNTTDTTMTISDETQKYYYSAAAKTMVDWSTELSMYAAMYFRRVGSTEYMRQTAGDGTNSTIVRGALGTTATSHTAGNTLDYFFAVEGNVIDTLLGLLITRATTSDAPGLEQPDAADDATWDDHKIDFSGSNDSAAVKGPLGLGILTADVDPASFFEVRDKYFRQYLGRFFFSATTDMLPYIRRNILKPLGLNFYINRAGKLALAIMRPPLAGTPEVLTKDDIINVPELEFTNEELLNDITINYEKDATDTEFQQSVEVIDATSQATYDKEATITLEMPWMHDALRGAILAPRIAKKKKRAFVDPNPTTTIDVLFNRSDIEPGQVVRLTYDDLPDPQNGVRGWDRLVWIAGKRVNWETGTLSFDVIDSSYFGKRYGLIAESGQADFSSATDEQKASYVFISGASDTMSDDTTGYQIT